MFCDLTDLHHGLLNCCLLKSEFQAQNVTPAGRWPAPLSRPLGPSVRSALPGRLFGRFTDSFAGRNL
jgi:hypothetical protein